MIKMNYRFKNSRLLLFFSTLLLYISMLQIIFGLAKHLNGRLIDFDIYYRYSRILLSGNSPYGLEFTQGIPFNYPPSSFLLFAPFSLPSFLSASLLFTATSFFSFLLAIYWLLKLLFKQKYLRFILISLLIQNFPFKFSLVTGQSNLIVLSLLIFAFIFDHKKRPYLSGLFWGFAASIKLMPLSLFLYFLLTKKFKSLITGILLFLLANLLVLLISPESISYLKTHLPSLLSIGGIYTSLYDQSLRAFFARLNLNSVVFSSNLVVLSLIFFTAWKHYYGKFTLLNNLKLFSQILIITVIGNSFAWQHHFILTFPALITASKIALNKKSWGYWSVLLLSAILIGMHFRDIAHPPTTNPILVSHTLMGALILYGLLITN